jgi:hypothetical protein
MSEAAVRLTWAFGPLRCGSAAPCGPRDRRAPDGSPTRARSGTRPATEKQVVDRTRGQTQGTVGRLDVVDRRVVSSRCDARRECKAFGWLFAAPPRPATLELCLFMAATQITIRRSEPRPTGRCTHRCWSRGGSGLHRQAVRYLDAAAAARPGRAAGLRPRRGRHRCRRHRPIGSQRCGSNDAIRLLGQLQR